MSPELLRNAGRHRVRSSKQHGSGVGLFLARRVVEDQGGSLDVESSTDGTTVRVLLPAAEPPRSTPMNAGNAVRVA